MSQKKKIVLSMIVKNETHIIKECFDSLHKFIDYWVICDTGSTDGTQELITQYFKEKGIPGELHQHEWEDFATNRTKALDLCTGKGDYAWMIDADDYLVGEMQFPVIRITWIMMDILYASSVVILSGGEIRFSRQE